MMPHTVPNKSDKRRYRGSGSQPVHTALQPGDFFADSELERAFQREFVGQRTSGFHLPVDLAVSEIEDGNQRRDAELLARDGDRVHAVGLAKGAQKLGVRAARSRGIGSTWRR